MVESVKDAIMMQVGKDVIANLQREIDIDDLNYTGQLRNSWQIKRRTNGTIVVGSLLIWAKVMNDGRLPGKMTPIKALFPWVFQKIGGKDEQEIKQKAFLVARKIAEKGIEPRHYVQRALFKLEAGV